MKAQTTRNEIAIEPVTRPVDAVVTLPGSKSITNRALLIAALAEGPSEIRQALDSDDTRAMADVLRAVGIAVPQLGHDDAVRDGAGRARSRPVSGRWFAGHPPPPHPPIAGWLAPARRRGRG